MNSPSAITLSPQQRYAGVCLHISSLPGPYGIGELGRSARNFIDDMVRMQLSVWQFLPIGPTAYGDSPYQPLSTFAGNELFIDIENLVDLGLLSSNEVSELRALPERYVDYGALIPVKNGLLSVAATRFAEMADDAMRSDFDAFLARNNSAWLHDYAVYRVLKTHHGERPWPEWQPRFVHRNETALRDLEQAEAGQIEAIKIQQFLFFRQWRQLYDYAHANGVFLFADLPIYIALDSADAWANPKLVMIDEEGRPDCVAGVPPDYFSEDGQLWGNPLYDWERHKASNYSWWVERLKAVSEIADLVRIDHFRGFESYWCIPADSDTARVGSWEPGPGDELFEAMQQSLGSLSIVAEDLGVITPEVEHLRDRHNLPGMRVLQFVVCDANFQLDHIGTRSVCYTGTHDNDTVVGWFRGGPGDTRSEQDVKQVQDAVLRFTGGSAESVHDDLIKAAFSTDAYIAMAPMQDYLGLGSEARFNTPGITHGNWRWRLLGEHMTPHFCHNVESMVKASGRGIS